MIRGALEDVSGTSIRIGNGFVGLKHAVTNTQFLKSLFTATLEFILDRLPTPIYLFAPVPILVGVIPLCDGVTALELGDAVTPAPAAAVARAASVCLAWVSLTGDGEALSYIWDFLKKPSISLPMDMSNCPGSNIFVDFLLPGALGYLQTTAFVHKETQKKSETFRFQT